MGFLSQAIGGTTRVADAAEEKFNELLEQSGYTEEDVLNYQKEKEEGESSTKDEDMPSDEGSSSNNDENTIPTPENLEGGEGAPQNGADMAAAQAGIEGGAAPAAEIPPEALQMGGAEGAVAGGVPGGEAAAQGAVGMTPDEEELLRQQQAAAAQQGAPAQQ